MSGKERYHQTYAKTLLSECPAVLRAKLDGKLPWVPTKTTELGSLLDSWILGGEDSYLEVPCKDYRKAVARELRDEAREAGKIPMLTHEIQPVRAKAAAMQKELYMRGIDLDDKRVIVKPRLSWTGPDGVDCSGEPDIVCLNTGTIKDARKPTRMFVDITTLDLKCGVDANPVTVEKQVENMFWDVQGVTYREAVLDQLVDPTWTVRSYHHVMARLCTRTGLMSFCPLSQAWWKVGELRSSKARTIWQGCQESGEWPAYSDRELQPSKWLLRDLVGEA